MDAKILNLPCKKEELAALSAGDNVLISGTLFTGRDAAHKRVVEAIDRGETPPIPLEGQGIYYVGPCKKDGKVMSAGPTTSYRMDKYAPRLYKMGLRVTIGKGDRSDEVYAAIKESGGVYLAAIGGAGALYAGAVKSATVIAYDDLGTEAIHRFEVQNFPAVVAIDCNGNSIYRR